MTQLCPICRSKSGAKCKTLEGAPRWYKAFECDACGRFALRKTEDLQQLTDMQRAALSHLLRTSTSCDVKKINSGWIREFTANARLPNPAQQAANLTRLIGDHFSKTGEGYLFDEKIDYTRIGALSPDMLRQLRHELEKKGLIQTIQEVHSEEPIYGLTLDG